jgi:RND family efflux transporter MFP subunit
VSLYQLLTRCLIVTTVLCSFSTQTMGQTLGQTASSESEYKDIIHKGVTQPSSRKELAFSYQGIIANVPVKKGDMVTAGQLLMKQDDRIEMRRLDAMKLDADRSLLIKAKQATLDNKKVELKRKGDMYKSQALSESEFLQAELEVVLAGAELDVTRHEEKIKAAEVATQDVRVDQMELKSPIDGIVLDIFQTEGEVADINKPSIVVIKNDPLYIEIKTLPYAVVGKLRTGDVLDVRYNETDAWQKATINYIAPEADARAGTQSIRLEMPNPEKRSTGEQIDVKIPRDATMAGR